MTTETTTPETPTRSRGRTSFDLFLISFLILFFELAAIRWFGSTVVFLTFFTNIVLLACFLGMSVGCLATSRKTDFMRFVLPLTALGMVLALGILDFYSEDTGVTIDVGNQESPERVYFGTGYRRASDPSQFVIPIEAVAGIFFALISLIFVGLGQILGRLLNEHPSRIGAYTFNIAGSLVGILAFGGASYFHTTPHFWFAIIVGLCLYFLTRWTGLQAVCLVFILFLSGASSYQSDEGQVFWSPYYKVEYMPQWRNLVTNNISHQYMTPVDEQGPGYMLPHLLNRDAGNAPFGEMMIIGAGSGNDVSAALASGVGHVDAVEIDPVLNGVGRRDHPNKPYEDERVDIVLDDGRRYLQRTERTYDLVVYALVDSLVLHSGYSSLRLESFLFTREAFQSVHDALAEDGMFAMYNFYRRGWVVTRLVQLAREVFGTEPIVISLPYQEEIGEASDQSGRRTLILVGKPASTRMEAIRAAFAANSTYWIGRDPRDNTELSGFEIASPPEGDAEAAALHDERWLKIAPATLTHDPELLPEDDWPFLYLRQKTIPRLNLRGMGVIAVLSIVILLAFAPIKRARPNGQMFFLGAGFMLLETKGVVHMALLFGSTWVVNSVVFTAILIAILFANAFVLTFKPKRTWPFYILLLLGLGANVAIPMNAFLALEGPLRTVASCLVVFVPIFFAGVVFASAFGRSRHPDVDFGSNIAGVILGGLSEFLSLMIGFNHLILVAVAFYVLSALFRPRDLAAVPG